MENYAVFAIVSLAAILLAGIGYFHLHKFSFTKLVFISLALGVVFGFGIQFIYGATGKITTNAIDWINIVGNGYIALLQMLIIPLIFVSLVGAFTKLKVSQNLRRISFSVLSTLLITTAIAAFIGILSVFAFHLQGASFINGAPDKANLAILKQHQSQLTGLTLPQQIVSFLPVNIFADFAGTRATSTISVVIFSLFVGVAFLYVRKNNPEPAKTFADFIEALHQIVSRIVHLVLQLTPYGIFALMAKATATDSIEAIGNLGIFIIAAYAALLVVLIVHTIILVANKVNPVVYYKKVWPALIFAFTSRTSAGTLPLNVQIQEKSLGIDSAIANFAASFGLTIGQNGCAGVYPAMIATIIAPTVGINVVSVQWVLTLIAVVTISSFGVAGVGGGSTFTTLMVLGTLNLPITIMGVIIAIDPIVDMARTLVNVNDSIVAGVVTARQTKSLDTDTLADSTKIVESVI
ncbi:L-cystine uptake protein TcyP [Lentilactobacillus sunkii]|jgi:L-cystine uptake protein TcyP (sodium:dicarboxylate symporter family)|uniref:L-cystine uptake protein TcyP n=1 Tax=Lentilactobacillus sunkii TaxID=481719 RepID=A0A1E7X9M4_9LACO|nr:cation:dicarboxylase symporter family transporter [Lentilactobacillus sunkii]OFA09780.1 L-cystine uptake protein TcyP [Lentilactobacillus sunkii]